MLGITTNIPSSNYSTTWELQSTLQASGIEWPALRNQIPYMAHVIQLAVGAFMSSLGVKGHTKLWEAHERDQQYVDNASTHFGKSQRLRKEGNTRINKVSAMKPGLAKLIVKVRISRYSENSETGHHVAANDSCVDYIDTWSSKRVYWLSKSQCTIAVLPIMDVKTWWNSTLELLEQAYWLLEFTCEWLKHPKYSDCRSLYTTEDQCTIVKYVMGVLMPFRYWSLWVSKRHMVTLHHVITVYNDMFDHMDGVLQALAKNKTQWKEDLYFTVNFARQKLSKFYAEVTPTMGKLLISAHILDPFGKLRSLRKWDKGMDINAEDETSYTTQYHEALLKYVENEYCAKHRQLSVTKHEKLLSNAFTHSATPFQSGQSSFDLYDLSSGDEEYLTPKYLAKMTPGLSDRAARLLTAARL